jgi:hypothetical protein
MMLDYSVETVCFYKVYCVFRPGPENEGPYNFTRIGAGMVNNEVRLSGLEKFAKYSVTVQAFNSRGDGPTCDAVIVQTLEDGENFVSSIICGLIKCTYVLVVSTK